MGMTRDIATVEGTERFASQFPNHQYRQLGRTGLYCSELGFGSYRVDQETPTHQTAFEQALRSGVNLIDTSTNYMDGESERMIGDRLHDAFDSRVIQRDEVILVSKAGYIQGSLHEQCLADPAGPKYEDIRQFHHGLAYCLDPEFINDQIEQSLDRLLVDSLDVFLLHNPEYYLMHLIDQEKENPQIALASYYQVLRQAFETCESAVKKGWIQCYGVSSNTLPSPVNDPYRQSLETMEQLAESISDSHHFSVIQFPFNIYESGAAFYPHTEDGRSLLDYAESLNKGVLINRPLNAMTQGHMFRLAERQIAEPDTQDLDMDLLDSLEQSLSEKLGESLSGPSDWVEEFHETALSFSKYLNQANVSFDDWEYWIESQFIPRVQIGLEILSAQGGSSTLVQGYQDYVYQVKQYVQMMVYERYQDKKMKIHGLKSEIAKHIIPGSEALSLSQQALRAYRSIPSVSCILLGMRHPLYVDEAAIELESPRPAPSIAQNWIDLDVALLSQVAKE